jgi:lipid II:glycine glycyltransferase (peptidoglycan interpeptide bridge formation enzyme)
MGATVRNKIRKAQKNGLKVVPCDSSLVSAMAEKTFKRQHKSLPYSKEYLNQLYVAAKQHDAGECFAAIDGEARTHAAAFVVWDHKRAYNLVTGTDPELRASGAESFLLWHLLEFIAVRSGAFDFAGSVVQHIEQFERGFGARLVPYNRILKIPRLCRLVLP